MFPRHRYLAIFRQLSRRKLWLTLELSNPSPWIVRARLHQGFTHVTKLAVSNDFIIPGKDLYNALATEPALQALCPLKNLQFLRSFVSITIKDTINVLDTMYLTEFSRKLFDQDLEHYNAGHTKYFRALASSRFSTLLTRSLQ